MKCKDVFNSIINESAVSAEKSRYKVYGFFQIAEDNYEEGELNDVSRGMFEEFFGKTPEYALDRLAAENNFVLNSKDFEFTNINGKTEIQGTFTCNKDGQRINVEDQPELYEKWKSGEINLYVYNYQIIIQKVTYANIDDSEQQRIIDEFSKVRN